MIFITTLIFTPFRGGEPEQQIKKIPKAAAQKFAAAVYEFQNLPNQSYIDPTYVSDAGYCQATVFGIRFEWREIGTDQLDQPYQNISKAFWNLIASLKEE